MEPSETAAACDEAWRQVDGGQLLDLAAAEKVLGSLAGESRCPAGAIMRLENIIAEIALTVVCLCVCLSVSVSVSVYVFLSMSVSVHMSVCERRALDRGVWFAWL